MSTTPEQIRLVMEAIKLHMEGEGFVCEWGTGLAGTTKSEQNLLMNNTFYIKPCEFEGAKWKCLNYEVGININAPDSLDKLKAVATYCSGDTNTGDCTDCPARTGDFTKGGST